MLETIRTSTAGLLRVVFALLLVFAAIPQSLRAQAPAPQPGPAGQTASVAKSDSAKKPAYSLSPEKLEKAIVYSRERMVLAIVATLWSVVQLWLLLATGLVALMRDLAVRVTDSRWLQCGLFVLQLLLATTLLEAPITITYHVLGLRYGQSIQGWLSWLGDHGKEVLVSWIIGTALVILLFWIIRKSPLRWWFWFSMLATPLTILGFIATPIIYDPLFHHFEPLQQSDPALTARLEQVVARTGVAIPPERIFLMQASEKVTGINAYVTGLGPSKRFVMWDTALSKLTPDQILFVFGHETGHYVLHHVAQGLALSVVLTFLSFYLAFHAVRWLLVRFGPRWGVSSQNDWAALVILVMVLNLFTVLGEPMTNAFSRHIEHEADIYGQEAIHGLVADPQSTAVSSFQRLGENSLDDPNPSPVLEFWLFNHPSVGRRAAFAQSYNPWVEGQQPKYFSK